MITGTINAKIEAVVALEVFEAQGASHTLEAILDTGYSGCLSLPPETAAAFGLNSTGFERVTLADGSTVLSSICPARIIWDGKPFRIDIDVLETAPLVGMGLMTGYDLNARIIPGGTVMLTECELNSP